MQLIFKRPSLVGGIILLGLIISRWYVGGMDFSYFAVIGNDFVNPQELQENIHVEEGPGYDGQFFYALATNPFTDEVEINGIKLDHPAYRHQRIIYPLLAWVFSLGSMEMTGFALVFVNILSFLSIISLFKTFCEINEVKGVMNIFPILLCGLWMSIGRDLSEAVEGVYIIAALMALLHRRIWIFTVFATFAILTRESSAIILGPLAATWCILEMLKVEQNKLIHYLRLVVPFVIPFVVLVFWKMYLKNLHGSEVLIEGGGNFTFPIVGIYTSFKLGLNYILDVESLIEFGIWFSFIVWNFWFIWITRKALQFDRKKQFTFSLSVAWLVAFVVSLCFSHSIYIDDWAFLRVLSGFYLLSGILLIVKKIRLPNLFVVASALLLCMTLVRLIFRV